MNICGYPNLEVNSKKELNPFALTIAVNIQLPYKTTFGNDFSTFLKVASKMGESLVQNILDPISPVDTPSSYK